MKSIRDNNEIWISGKAVCLSLGYKDYKRCRFNR